jgi:tetratricopeptide (TPR) repeat protein
MSKLYLAIATAAATLIAGSASAADICKQSADRLDGRSAFACGNTWTAGNSFEKAVTYRPTVLARFNLASAYAATGRYQAAADLYESVIADGVFVRLMIDPERGDQTRTAIRVNATEEAQRRLMALTFRMANDRSPASLGAPSALDAAADAAMTGPPSVRSRSLAIIAAAHVPDDRALAFDRTASGAD